jgi:hypothetical protein
MPQAVLCGDVDGDCAVLVRSKAASASALRCTSCTGFCQHLELAGEEQEGSAGRLCLSQSALEREVKEYLDENRTAPRVTSISQVCGSLSVEQPTHTWGHTCLSSSYCLAHNLRCERSCICLAGPISDAQAFGPRSYLA